MTNRPSSTRHAADRSGRRTGREIVSGLAAALALTLAVVGLPIALYLVAGIPLPHHSPSPGQLTHAVTERDNGQLFLSALLVVAWAAWAVFTVSVLVEAVAFIRGTAAVRLPGCAPTQQVAAALLAAVGLLLISAPQIGQVQPTPHPSATTMTALTAWQSPPPTRPVVGHNPPAAPSRSDRADLDTGPNYTVQRGDTLWSIAETHLGNPERWREIARLNYDHPQPDGRTLTNSHWIYPGWHLRLPPDPATAHAAHRHTDAAATSPSPIRQAQPAPHEPTPATAPSAKPSVIDGRTPASPPAERLTSAPSITLASGSEISAAFAVGVLAAMSTARLRRRRAYRPAPPMPATTPTGAPPAAALRALMIATRPRDEDGDSELSSDEARPPTTTDGTGVDVAPGTLEIGTRDSRRITLGLTEWACLAITGEARDSVVRFWLASLIVDSGPYGADIIGAAATLDRLIPGLSERLHALRPVADADAVLASLEAEQLRRTRLLADADVESVADLRGLHAEDPLPITIAVLDSIDPRRAARWELLTTAASRLGMRILTLDADGHGRGRAHLVTDVDGAILSAEPAEFRHALGGVRLFTMTVDEALVFLGPVAAASRESDEQTASDSIAGQTETQAGSCSLTPEVPQALSFPPPPATVAMARWPIQRPTDAEPPVALRLFGPIALRAWGRPIDVGLRDSARELLAWYVVHPDGVPAGTAIEGIWPDVPADRGSQRFWNALGNLRSRLRGPGGERLDVLTKIGDSYRPDVNALDVDIWRFQDALDHAVRDESRARDVLMVAANLYRGEFAGTSDYVWVAPVREEFHRRALDAYVRLAELHDEAGEADAAVEILERAITLDPVAEEIYRRLIRLLGRAGRADAVSRLWAQLQGRLADIDLDPEPATITLVRRIQNAGADPQIVNASRH